MLGVTVGLAVPVGVAATVGVAVTVGPEVTVGLAGTVGVEAPVGAEAADGEETPVGEERTDGLKVVGVVDVLLAQETRTEISATAIRQASIKRCHRTACDHCLDSPDPSRRTTTPLVTSARD